MRPSREEFDQFETFLMEMPDVMAGLKYEAQKLGFRLDNSLESLDALEGYWLAVKDYPDAEVLFNRCARYLGEVFRYKIGGSWQLCVDNPRKAYFKLPVITGFRQGDFDFCPLAIMNNFRMREVRGLLKRVVESWLT